MENPFKNMFSGSNLKEKLIGDKRKELEALEKWRVQLKDNMINFGAVPDDRDLLDRLEQKIKNAKTDLDQMQL